MKPGPKDDNIARNTALSDRVDQFHAGEIRHFLVDDNQIVRIRTGLEHRERRRAAFGARDFIRGFAKTYFKETATDGSLSTARILKGTLIIPTRQQRPYRVRPRKRQISSRRRQWKRGGRRGEEGEITYRTDEQTDLPYNQNLNMTRSPRYVRSSIWGLAVFMRLNGMGVGACLDSTVRRLKSPRWVKRQGRETGASGHSVISAWRCEREFQRVRGGPGSWCWWTNPMSAMGPDRGSRARLVKAARVSRGAGIRAGPDRDGSVYGVTARDPTLAGRAG